MAGIFCSWRIRLLYYLIALGTYPFEWILLGGRNPDPLYVDLHFYAVLAVVLVYPLFAAYYIRERIQAQGLAFRDLDAHASVSLAYLFLFVLSIPILWRCLELLVMVFNLSGVDLPEIEGPEGAGGETAGDPANGDGDSGAPPAEPDPSAEGSAGDPETGGGDEGDDATPESGSGEEAESGAGEPDTAGEEATDEDPAAAGAGG